MKVKNQFLKILEYLHLSFNKRPSTQYKFLEAAEVTVPPVVAGEAAATPAAIDGAAVPPAVADEATTVGVPDVLELHWSVPPAPPWPSAMTPELLEPRWSIPPAPSWPRSRTSGLSEPPWLNPPIPPWTILKTSWAYLLARA